MAEKIKVLIVDDSALVRQVVSQALATDPDIEVIGAASDPIFAIQKMKVQWPDVLVIEIGRAHVLTPVTPISRMPSSA